MTTLAERLVDRLGCPWPGPASFHRSIYLQVMRVACEWEERPARSAQELLERLDVLVDLKGFNSDVLPGITGHEIEIVYHHCRGYFMRVAIEAGSDSARDAPDLEAVDLEGLLNDRRSRLRKIWVSVSRRRTGS